MTTERLMAVLDGARLVRYNPDGYLLVWHGGHGVHAYDESFDEVGFWNVGDLSQSDASESEVRESMAESMLRGIDEESA